MANSKLIVIEGPQGAGKTTITDFIRHSLKYTNLYRLSGTADSSRSGLEKAQKMYFNLLDYVKKLENESINLLFDRTFFTEENYCRLGKKEYSFTDTYNELLERFSKLDFDIYYITLYLEDKELYNMRLQREGKANIDYAKFEAKSSIEQQKVYLDMLDEIQKKYPNINATKISTDDDLEIVKNKIREFIKY